MSHRWPILISFCLGVAISFLRFGSAILHPDSVLLGGWDHPDSLSNHWLLVWISTQMAAGESILHNDLYYVPVGDKPWLAGNGSVGFWMAPFLWVLGWPTGVPIGFSVLWGGIAMAFYWLCQGFQIRRWAALFPISLVLCMPYLGHELSAGRFSQVDILWLCLSWAGLMHLFQKNNLPVAILTGVCVSLTAVMYWYYAWFFVLIALWVALSMGVLKQITPWSGIAIAAGVSVLCISPIAVLFAHNWAAIPGTQELIFPSPEAVQSGMEIFPMTFLGPGLGGQSVLCWIGCGLAVVLGFREGRSPLTLSLIGIAFIFGLLSMGTNTPMFEMVYGLATPLKRFWWPARHVLVFGLAVSLLAAHGVRAFMVHNQLWGKNIVMVSLALLVPFTHMAQGQSLETVTTPLSGVPMPYAELDFLPEGGVIHLPLSPEISVSQAPLYFQLYHQRPMLNGHAQWVDRVRPELWDAQIDGHVFLSDLQSYEHNPLQNRIRFNADELEYLKTLNLRYIVLDPSLFSKPLAPMLRGLREGLTVLFGSPVHRHQSVLIWDTHNWTKRSEVSLSTWEWPSTLIKGNGSQPIRGPKAFNPYLKVEKHK
ncbi:MAG: hypothetical protein ACON4U_02020 [Myxococcota bacterium]